ncbi:cell-envelope stress modulator CpxP [Pantoea stewartii]|uniref:P pilus assembly/Cpx signaling pathway periplasmic inhibitor/zinc resistance-associated protein n=1 Tax=Pantoea stewartii subsp. stewartii DC283 TaxID=660596 RepID=H3RIF4_PANSE|nr:cell-envelope stress modulator CpxP [Pantoea stewartii]ARF48365.1 stress adaptor protein CpxP [Pantoea stewartii subsp. stewartii DC283]EHT98916.1 P pilus assembly/Cpx signaling pathway periplasmic inhibitor/zinc resistance-associated protein [Pantoea stewartii subsp. stewartii DC283]KAB0553049.1 cell-envelope stress modulator CpxP [Pantoea stewartii subsp. stewartii]
MRKLTAVVLASAMVLSHASAGAAESMALDEVHHGGFTTGSMTQNSQSHMFDVIELTEHQRQQMRDLMQQARHDRPATNIDDIAAMHDLVTADKFNEAAIRDKAEALAKVQVEQQVEMARVRNQMYHLLTPEQQAALQKNYEQRLNAMRKLSSLQPASTLQPVSRTSSNQ